ncbi:MAG: hypothetical protein K6D57_00095 [Paludibacteraceae bacterium]|nr:hypothetical protein [Paludibacteraceae bacterium]
MSFPSEAREWIQWWLTQRGSVSFVRSCPTWVALRRQLHHLASTQEYTWIGQEGLLIPSPCKKWLMSLYGSHASGAYFPLLNSTKYRITISQHTQHLRVHELTHALGFFKKQERQILRAYFTMQQWKKCHNPYWDNPWEIYARVMEFRFQQNLIPQKRLLPIHVRQFRSSGLLHSVRLHFYSDDFLLYLFNKVV